jgi:hypothetical protein
MADVNNYKTLDRTNLAFSETAFGKNGPCGAVVNPRIGTANA